MKKTLIILGILLILIIVGVWVYLFLFNNGDSGGRFANFGVDEDSVEFPVTTDDEVINDDASQQSENLLRDMLRQLTTKEVAAAVFMGDMIRFVERGTGFIFDIHPTRGSDSQVTNTTLPRVVDAEFSPSGNRVAFITEDGEKRSVLVGTITKNDTGEGVVDGVSLPEGSRELQFSESGSLIYYVLPDEDGASGYSYNLTDQSQATLFSIPLRDVRVLWGDPIYVATTPTAEDRGHLYQVTGNTLKYMRPSAFGLTAKKFDGELLLSGGGEIVSTERLSGGEWSNFPVNVFLEKCAHSMTSTSTYFCTAPVELLEIEDLDLWYKGLRSFSDNLFIVDVADDSIKHAADFLALSGREIDVVDIQHDAMGEYLSLINKNDNSLWVFDIGDYARLIGASF